MLGVRKALPKPILRRAGGLQYCDRPYVIPRRLYVVLNHVPTRTTSRCSARNSLCSRDLFRHALGNLVTSTMHRIVAYLDVEQIYQLNCRYSAVQPDNRRDGHSI